MKAFLSSGKKEGEAFLMSLRSLWWLSRLFDALTDVGWSIPIAQFNSGLRFPAFTVPSHLKSL